MIKLNTNDKAFRELTKMAESKNMNLKEFLLSEEYISEVCEIFYSNMPKMVKWSMSFEKFKIFYTNNKESFVSKIPN
jgi:hypothetical protein